MEVDVLFEDKSILVMNKPSGILVHPVEDALAKNARGEETCISILRRHCHAHVFPVHRLDRATSGAVLFAKSALVASELGKQIARCEIEKEYVALVRGWLMAKVDVCHPVWNEIRTKRVEAQTEFAPLEKFEISVPSGNHASSRYSLVSAFPKTGRYHQIRQHFKHLSHPIVGDSTHGDGVHNRIFREHFDCHRLFLHAVSLTFLHPETRLPVVVKSSLPIDLERVLRSLR